MKNRPLAVAVCSLPNDDRNEGEPRDLLTRAGRSRAQHGDTKTKKYLRILHRRIGSPSNTSYVYRSLV